MQSEPELFAPRDVLRMQMSTNREQLRYLERLASAEFAKAIYLQMLVMLVAVVTVIVGYFAILEPSRIPVRKELYDLSGVIFVFLVFALIRSGSALLSAYVRRREIHYLCAMQHEALEFAEHALEAEAKKKARL
jgi:uncharacterized membrane protein YbhN (UPF0104 family)